MSFFSGTDKIVRTRIIPDGGNLSLQKYTLTGVNDDNSPKQVSNFILNQNYPNPFNPSTVISYFLERESFVKIEIYDALGSQVKLLQNDIKDAGQNSVTFNASGLPSGVYFYKLSATSKDGSSSFTDIKKMILIK